MTWTPEVDATGTTRDIVGAAVGMSGVTYQRARAVVAAVASQLAGALWQRSWVAPLEGAHHRPDGSFEVFLGDGGTEQSSHGGLSPRSGLCSGVTGALTLRIGLAVQLVGDHPA